MELTYGSFQNIFVINNAATQTPIKIIWIVMLTIGVCVAAYLITKSSKTDADRNQTTSYKLQAWAFYTSSRETKQRILGFLVIYFPSDSQLKQL